MFMSHARSRSAFTILELLMAVVIIAILAGITIPAMSLVRNAARKASCASNLRQWGMGLNAIAADQRHAMPLTAVDGSGLAPRRMWLDRRPPNGEQMNLSMLASHFANGDLLATEIAMSVGGAGVAAPAALKRLPGCPGTSGWRQAGVDDAAKGPWLELGYSYVGRSDKWPAGSTNRPELFSGRQVDASSVLMSETLAVNAAGVPINAAGHARSNAGNRADGQATQSWQTMTGINQLFGDGAVRFKSISQLDLPALLSNDPGAARIGAVGSTSEFF